MVLRLFIELACCIRNIPFLKMALFIFDGNSVQLNSILIQDYYFQKSSTPNTLEKIQMSDIFYATQ